MAERKEHPVLWGLVALVSVAAAVGLILGFGALAATRLLGVGGGSADSTAGAEASMYLPRPERTARSAPAAAESTRPAAPRSDRTKTQEPQTGITLTAGQSSVGPMQQIDLSGQYPQGEGAILQVQRFQSGAWVDFPVTVSVSAGGFSTYVQTGQTGVNRFRVFDSDRGEASNEVRITIG